MPMQTTPSPALLAIIPHPVKVCREITRLREELHAARKLLRIAMDAHLDRGQEHAHTTQSAGATHATR